MIRTITRGIFLGTIALFAHSVFAASLLWVPSNTELGVGGRGTITLKIDSEGVGLNAAQGTIRFPKETIQVTSIDKATSAFSFWLQDPTFSNTDGVISFVGGTPYGISGSSIEVFKVNFTAKGSGAAAFTSVDAAITASDGSGTNILSKTQDATITVSPARIGGAEAPTTPAAGATPVVPAPQQIVREAAPAKGLPEKPTLNVPLYPDPTKWYSASNLFNTRWTLPADVTGVAAVLNKQPSTAPGESEGLFDNKTFAPLSDGIWYLHVRFRNAVGWGPVTHHRIAIDSQTPLPFTVSVREGEKGDIPTVTLEFQTTDALSGVDEYHIQVDTGESVVVPAASFSGEYKLTLTEPGKHRILVRAHDKASNGIEVNVNYELVPLASPSFTFVTNRVYSDEPIALAVRGSALPDTRILLALKQDGAIVASSTIATDQLGNWEYVFSNPLRNGTYITSAQNQDMRGALSLTVTSSAISVLNRPILELGPISLDYRGFTVLLLLLIIGMIAGGYYFYRAGRNKIALRLDVALGDTTKAFKMIKADIDKVNATKSTPTPADDEFALKKLEDDVKKMESYIPKEISKAKE